MKHEALKKNGAVHRDSDATQKQGTDSIYSDNIETLFALQNSSVVLVSAQKKKLHLNKIKNTDKI